MTPYMTPKVKQALIAIFLAVLPCGCTAIPESNNTSQAGCSNLPEENQGCVEVTRVISEGDRVKMRVKVFNEEGGFNPNLQPPDFTVETLNEFGSKRKIKPTVIIPTFAKTTPADVIIMLDMTGSMKHSDSSGTIKFKAAINAINKFIDAVNNKPNLTVRIGLAPFGEGGNEFKVTNKSLEENFYSSQSSKLKEKVEQLSNQTLSASTNLYKPLTTAVEYLRDTGFSNSGNNNSTNNRDPQQLVVILLSDGFHNYQRDTEETQFNRLRDILKPQDQKIPRVTVHTLGYGESLKDIYNNSQCSLKLTEAQLTKDDIIIKDKVIEKIINNCRRVSSKISIDEFIVDQPRLRQIANLTGGIHQFPDNAEEVAESLIKFLETLQEYQLEYNQPEADRATKHQAKVLVKNLTSNAMDYRICNIGCPPLKEGERTLLALGTLTMFGLMGIFPFMKWSQRLRQDYRKQK